MVLGATLALRPYIELYLDALSVKPRILPLVVKAEYVPASVLSNGSHAPSITALLKLFDVTNRPCISGRLSASANKTSILLDVIIAQSEALPNIQAYIRAVYTWYPDQKSGAFSTALASESGFKNNATKSDAAPYNLYFNASGHNPIYGRANNVRPMAVSVCYWRRRQ